MSRPSSSLPSPGAFLPEHWETVLRFAFDADDPAGRCSRRSCRAAGMCRFHWREGSPIDCPAVSDESLVRACGVMIFGLLVREAVLDGKDWPEPEEGDRPSRPTRRASP